MNLVRAHPRAAKSGESMRKRLKPIPKFANEAAERAFWESPQNDSTEYVDWSKAKLAVSDEAFAAWQKEAGEPEPGYDEWFRKGVEEALADESPGLPHEQVEQEIGNILRRAREAKKPKESAR